MVNLLLHWFSIKTTNQLSAIGCTLCIGLNAEVDLGLLQHLNRALCSNKMLAQILDQPVTDPPFQNVYTVYKAFVSTNSTFLLVKMPKHKKTWSKSSILIHLNCCSGPRFTSAICARKRSEQSFVSNSSESGRNA